MPQQNFTPDDVEITVVDDQASVHCRDMLSFMTWSRSGLIVIGG